MKKIAIIGTGRVGLPFGLFLESLGFSVTGIDKDIALLKILRDRIMPFEEPGCQDLLTHSRIQFTDDISIIKNVDYIFITVGTPLMPHIETDLSNVEAVIKSLIPHMQKGQSIFLRSTVAPRTTEYVKSFLEEHSSFRIGKNIALAFCPERLAEHKALAELKTLPQIIGCEDELSYEKAIEIFAPFNVKMFKTTYISAELVKLFNNSARYIEFAVANQFAIYANEFDQNIYDILRLANEDYPRGFIYRPGLTAGTCLRKDFGMINELSPGSDLLLASWKINEFMPYHLIELAARHAEIKGAKVAVLGYTFKRDSDDTRDSLVPKLIRYIERKVPHEIVLCEPNLKTQVIERYANRNISEALQGTDIVFVAVNHKEFSNSNIIWKALKPEALVIDIWNCLGKNQVVLRKERV